MIITIDDIKKLTDYSNHKAIIDEKTGYKSLDDITISFTTIINDYILEIVDNYGKKIYLPIIATENGHRALTNEEKRTKQEEEKAKQMELLQEEKRKKKQLAIIKENKIKVDKRKENGVREPSNSLTDDDKRNWWKVLEEDYPENYDLAQSYYYGPEDELLKKYGAEKKNYTINEYFELYGLPRIYTNDEHKIEVVR